jgi:hypothetical protein
MMKPIAPTAAAALLAGCSAALPPPHQLPPPAQGPSRTCPVIESSNWSAWVDAMPGPMNRPRLVVTGKVTVPTGGWRFAWRDVRIMESHPVQVSVDLQPIEPTGMVTEALVTHDINFEWPVPPPVGSVTIRCGGRVLAQIAPVDTAL